ncbi:MAG: exodeoxyribonuclease V subunit alpha [SAR324 cluster bacterium]|nr:exodeoxyribonuclease V subunit alpha [SAR324 cluster bacterium]
MTTSAVIPPQGGSPWSSLDNYLARFLAKLAGEHRSSELALAIRLLSHQNSRQHICLDLRQIAGKTLKETGLFEEASENIDEQDTQQDHLALKCPTLEAWIECLDYSGIVRKEQDQPEKFPLVLDARDRLYFQRYWKYQQAIADNFRKRISSSSIVSHVTTDKSLMNQLFPEGDASLQQKLAAEQALSHPFSLISGGPGTGKTYTVARLLLLLLSQTTPPDKLRIALAAPTGKAAARMMESLKQAKEQLKKQFSADSSVFHILQYIPETAGTLHRLLKTIPHSPHFRHHAQNPLPYEVLIVDEASMIDMALMAKLLDALPINARLILLGDKDQLASVEAGSVLGDLCEGAAGHMVLLTESRRFKSDSGIKRLSDAINQGKAQQAMTILTNPENSDLQYKTLPLPVELSKTLRTYLEKYQPYLEAVRDQNPVMALKQFEAFRILCAVRKGPYGVNTINHLLEQMILKHHSWIMKTGPVGQPTFYEGQPVLITRNHYPLGLFNGDIGIVLKTGETLKVHFPTAEGETRSISPYMLPDWETVFAMTVHKSQGSEFDEVLMILPDTLSPVVTRELLYTGITRARKHVELWFDKTPDATGKTLFETAVTHRMERHSGLPELLKKI